MALKKSLGLFRLTVYGVGTIIGAGIYSVIGPANAEAGAAIWVSFVLAAVISAFSAVSYAELASALPSAGAEHNFMREAFPSAPAAAFTVGLFIALHGAATLATVALTFGQYLQRFVEWSPVVVALVLMGLLTAVNIAGLERASSVNVVLTTLQVGCLVVLVGAAVTGDGFAANLRDRVSMPDDVGAVLRGTAIIFFIYTGYEHMASLAEEAKRPERDVWKAFLLALAVTTTVYLAIILASLSLMDPAELAKSRFPLAQVGEQRAPALGIAIALAALLATANAVLSASVSGSRLVFGMARSGDLPRPLARTATSRQSPWVAALAVLALAACLVAMGELKTVASLSSLGAVLVFTAVNASVIVLRYRKPDLARPFRVPSIGRFPWPSGLGIAVSLGLATQYDGRVYAIFAAGAALGLLGYLASRRLRERRRG